ncbi:phage regulatory protein/antirepressor Ant [Novacetimonas hansenii]
MSSREISELTGKQHAHVMRDIRAMLEQVGEGQSKFGSTYLDAQGKARECYNLPKNLTLNLITGYRADMRLKIIDRWLELEASTSPIPDPRVPRTLSEALRLAADQQDRIAAQADTIAQQQVRIERDAPKVSALARIAGTEGSIDMRQAAKNLQVKPILLRNFMRDRRWIYRKGEHWLAYQTKLDSGLLEHKLVTLHQESGRTKIVTRLRVTAKGISRLGEMLHGWGVAR